MDRATPLFALAAVLVGFETEAEGQSALELRYAKLRSRMVAEYIEAEGIENDRVLQSMRTVPRHEFVLPKDRPRAYFDAAIPIGFKQTISPPFVVAYMTQAIDPRPGERVLEIGTGSGYQAAVLSGLCKDVYTIEIVEQLGRSARRKLERLGYENVHCRIGDGYKGWVEHAPFDKIIVTCSPEKVPQPLVDQLAEGGRLIVPLGRRYQQVFHLFQKEDGKLVGEKLISTLFVPMTGEAEDQRRVKPDPANPRLVNGGFEIDENEDGRADGWHYQRRTTHVTEGAPAGKAYVAFENDDPGDSCQMLQGLALDGRRVPAVRLSGLVKYTNIGRGLQKHEQPALVVHFYDSIRRPIGEGVVGPFVGGTEWTRMGRTIRVPAAAREAVVRIGLNGATGELAVDDVQLEVVAP